MGIPAIVPRSALQQKPPHGEPCNRCGLCCMATMCPLAQHVFKRGVPGPCPALERSEAGYDCGLVANPGKYAIRIALKVGVNEASRAARHLIGSATGCDARINGEKPNEAFYEKLRLHDRATRDETRRARKVWELR